MKRRQTKPTRGDFGEEEMRRWWREKDFSNILNEVCITSDKDKDSIVNEIYDFVINA